MKVVVEIPVIIHAIPEFQAVERIQEKIVEISIVKIPTVIEQMMLVKSQRCTWWSGSRSAVGVSPYHRLWRKSVGVPSASDHGGHRFLGTLVMNKMAWS